jgi:deoxyribodipyrimidine photolyase-related protein
MSQAKASIWILGDQLLRQHPALKIAEQNYTREQLTVVLIESQQRTRRQPYQRKKLVLLFSAMRHYAAELRQQGYQVDYIQADSMLAGLKTHYHRHQPEKLYTMAASEFRGRHLQENNLADILAIPVAIVPNLQFLGGHFTPYPKPDPTKRYTQEYFYRDMRRHFNILLTDSGEPLGGAWNFDTENRKPLPAQHSPPPVLTFEPDSLTHAVMHHVAALNNTIGTVKGFNLAVSRAQAESARDDFFTHRLALFGPYEDAMSTTHQHLSHSSLSPYLNLGLLEPLDLIRRAEAAYHRGEAPLNSVEGFIRQILGWREYIYWQYWRLMPKLYQANHWQANREVPDFFWTGHTNMACLRHVLRRAIDTGYNHHIERLMVLCNFGMLTGLNPAALNDWFLSLYVDAYEWVMLPNVIGMGLNADGGQTATKPYIASANYINKMSDFCGACHYQPQVRTGPTACPFNFLYWNFLLTHQDTLRANPRLGRNVLGLRHLDEAERAAVQAQAAEFLTGLSR